MSETPSDDPLIEILNNLGGRVSVHRVEYPGEAQYERGFREGDSVEASVVQGATVTTDGIWGNRGSTTMRSFRLSQRFVIHEGAIIPVGDPACSEIETLWSGRAPDSVIDLAGRLFRYPQVLKHILAWVDDLSATEGKDSFS